MPKQIRIYCCCLSSEEYGLRIYFDIIYDKVIYSLKPTLTYSIMNISFASTFHFSAFSLVFLFPLRSKKFTRNKILGKTPLWRVLGSLRTSEFNRGPRFRHLLYKWGCQLDQVVLQIHKVQLCGFSEECLFVPVS